MVLCITRNWHMSKGTQVLFVRQLYTLQNSRLVSVCRPFCIFSNTKINQRLIEHNHWSKPNILIHNIKILANVPDPRKPRSELSFSQHFLANWIQTLTERALVTLHEIVYNGNNFNISYFLVWESYATKPCYWHISWRFASTW